MVKVFFIIGIVAIFISGVSMGAWTDRQGFHKETEGHPKILHKNWNHFWDYWRFIYSNRGCHVQFPKYNIRIKEIILQLSMLKS